MFVVIRTSYILYMHIPIYILNYDAEDQKAMPQISSSLSFFVQLLLM